MCHISMKIAQNPLQVGGIFPNPSLHIFAAPRSLAFRQAILAAKGASGDSEAAKKARHRAKMVCHGYFYQKNLQRNHDKTGEVEHFWNI